MGGVNYLTEMHIYPNYQYDNNTTNKTPYFIFNHIIVKNEF